MSEKKRGRGRPTDYNQDLVNKILERISEGESLRRICKSDDMPNISTIIRWRSEKEDFKAQYTHAREIQAYGILDELMDIVDDGSNDYMQTENGEKLNSEAIQRSKLRFDARKWFLSKMLPKVCGDKLDLNHSGSITQKQEFDYSKLSPSALAELEKALEDED